jgi:serine/threonine protein phosphatase PrpC
MEFTNQLMKLLTCDANLGYAMVQNKRNYQEDRFVCLGNEECEYFCICDGHCGSSCSEFLIKEIPKNLGCNNFNKETMTNVFAKLNKLYKEHKPKSPDGSCATVIRLDKNYIKTAYVGDSDAWVIEVDQSDIKIIQLTPYSHSPNNPEEETRIQKAGGKVFLGRMVDSNEIATLNVSRAFGNHTKKIAGLIVEPDYFEYEINTKSKYLIIATDGLREYKKKKNFSLNKISKSLIQFETNNPGVSPEKMAIFLIKKAIRRKSSDNITVIVKKLNSHSEETVNEVVSDVANESINKSNDKID